MRYIEILTAACSGRLVHLSLRVCLYTFIRNVEKVIGHELASMQHGI